MTGILRLMVIGAVVAALLAEVNVLTKRRIEANWQRASAAVLVEVTGDLRTAQIGVVTPPALICSAAGTPLYRIYGRTTRGYAGPITLLLGIDRAGKLTGVRTISHRETSGIGDVIDIDRSDWIRRFDGMTRATITTVDVVSSASVTTGAVVDAVHDALIDAADAPRQSCSNVLSE